MSMKMVDCWLLNISANKIFIEIRYASKF